MVQHAGSELNLPFGIVEVDPVFTPVVAIRNQLELLAFQRMMWVDDLKDGVGMVVMRCS